MMEGGLILAHSPQSLGLSVCVCRRHSERLLGASVPGVIVIATCTGV